MGNIIIIMNYFVMLILYLAGIFINEMSNKSIFYGVRIPIGYEKNEKLLELKKNYKRNYNLSFLVFVAIYSIIVFNVNPESGIAISIAATFVGVIIININYYIIYKKAKELKKSEGWKFESKNVVVIDTGFRQKDKNNKRVVVSPWWFLIPILIIVINVVVVLVKYPTIPEQIPGHYNGAGQIDRWDDKSYLSLLLIPIVQVFMTLFMYVIYRVIERAKQSLNGGEVGEVKYKSRKFRYMISGFIVVFSTIINLNFTITNFQKIEVLNLSGGVFTLTSIMLPLLPVIFLIIMVVKLSKNNDASYNTNVEEKITINRDDDDNYILGSFYYNKKDPALMVEKRVGLGMDFNYAKPAAKMIMTFIAIIIIGVFVLLAKLPGFTKERIVEVTPSAITVEGAWGLTITKEEIDKIALEEKLPKVLMKTNGADIGNKLMGKHKLANYDKSWLFIIDKTKPFVAVYTKDGRLVLINYEDNKKTEDLYSEMLNRLTI